MSKSKIKFFVEFSIIEKLLNTKYLKISSNGLDFVNFFHF